MPEFRSPFLPRKKRKVWPDRLLYGTFFALFLLVCVATYCHKQGTLIGYYLGLKEQTVGLTNKEKEDYLWALYNRGDLEKTIDLLQEVIPLSPEREEVHRSLLAQLYFKQRNYKKALAVYETLSNISERPEQYIFPRAQCFFHMGALAQALNLNYQLFSLEDRFIDNVEALLKNLLKQGKKQEGLSVLEGYLHKYPESKRYLELYRHRLEKLPNSKQFKEIRIPEIQNAFHVPVTIGTTSTPYKYIIDTGAQVMTITPQTFKKNDGVITKTGRKAFLETANGSQDRAEEVIIKSLKVGDIELRNVTAFLSPKVHNLLGQNVLRKFSIRVQKENSINTMILKKSM
jgi:predicted aspartyl protease